MIADVRLIRYIELAANCASQIGIACGKRLQEKAMKSFVHGFITANDPRHTHFAQAGSHQHSQLSVLGQSELKVQAHKSAGMGNSCNLLLQIAPHADDAYCTQRKVICIEERPPHRLQGRSLFRSLKETREPVFRDFIIDMCDMAIRARRCS